MNTIIFLIPFPLLAKDLTAYAIIVIIIPESRIINELIPDSQPSPCWRPGRNAAMLNRGDGAGILLRERKGRVATEVAPPEEGEG
jgi:hypothetical protein